MFSLNLKLDVTVVILLVLYNHFLHIWLAHTIDMLGMIQNSQKNTEIKRCHETYERFWLLPEGNTAEKQTPDNAPENTCTEICHHHTGALNSGGKIKICEKHQTFEVIR